jgi:UDPglucose 6-dehydrogenase
MEATMIGIIGFGFVGQAVYGSINHTSKVRIYDKYKGIGTLNELLESKVIFCCLPTNMVDGNNDKSQDFSEYKGFLDTCVEQMYKGVLIIKSTVLYSNLEQYVEKLNIVYNPEFLNQNTAADDFKNQHCIILGGRIDHVRIVEDLYCDEFDLNNDAKFEHCSIKEAAEIKYMHNAYHAYKVLFWNYVQEQTGNSRKIFNMYSKITGNTNEMSRVCADGRPGYGGCCFPKDVNALQNDKPHKLTEFMCDYNYDLREDMP